jgi:hypothetical protein
MLDIARNNYIGWLYKKGIDFYFPSSTLQSNTFNFNGRILRTLSWPSASEGIGGVVYE